MFDLMFAFTQAARAAKEEAELEQRREADKKRRAEADRRASERQVHSSLLFFLFFR